MYEASYVCMNVCMNASYIALTTDAACRNLIYLFFLSSFTAVGTTVAKGITCFAAITITTTTKGKSIMATAATVLSFSPYPHGQFSIAIAHMNVVFDDFQRILKQPSQFVSVQFMVLTHNAKKNKKKILSLSESRTTTRRIPNEQQCRHNGATYWCFGFLAGH